MASECGNEEYDWVGWFSSHLSHIPEKLRLKYSNSLVRDHEIWSVKSLHENLELNKSFLKTNIEIKNAAYELAVKKLVYSQCGTDKDETLLSQSTIAAHDHAVLDTVVTLVEQVELESSTFLKMMIDGPEKMFVTRLLSGRALPHCDAEEFRRQGIESTNLRSNRHRNLPFIGRDKTFSELLQAISSVFTIENKPSIVTLPAGPGQGKSELASRLVEQLEQYVLAFNKHTMTKDGQTQTPMEENVWLACAVTFNYHSELTPFEVDTLQRLFSADIFYETIVCLRLLYVWFVDKSKCISYAKFIGSLHAICKVLPTVCVSLNMITVVDLIARASDRSKIIVVIDESLIPLDKLVSVTKEGATVADKLALKRAVISSIAQLQEERMVMVFTNLRQEPFRTTTESGRQVDPVQMNNLNHGEAMQLIDAMIPVEKVRRKIITESALLRKYIDDAPFREVLLNVLATWSGGTPRLCEFAAGAIVTATSTLVNDIMDRMYNAYKTKYKEYEKASLHNLYLPRTVVVMALLGMKLPPSISCTMRDGSTVDDFIARGVLMRGADTQLSQSPMLLRYFCELVSPPLTSEQLSSSPSRSPVAESSVDPDDLLLANEIRFVMQCMHPSGDGKQFENFDRQHPRLVRLLRHQFAQDIANNTVALTDEKGVCVCAVIDGVLVSQLSLFDKQGVNWCEASLDDCFGSSKYCTLSPFLKNCKFNVSKPFVHDDCVFEEVPKYGTSTADIKRLTGRNHIPRDRSNAGFDWFRVEFDIVSRLLIAIISEDKFSASLESTSNKVNANEDIIEKCEKAMAAFENAKWPDTQVVYRLAAHRYLPKFQAITQAKFPTNIIVYGPTELVQSYSHVMQSVFNTMSWVDATKG